MDQRAPWGPIRMWAAAARAAAVTVIVAAALSSACAAPSRRLSSRLVEDPIVLPRRMASIAISPWKHWYRPSGGRSGDFELGVRIGLTDRLELSDLSSLRYAILDDAPGSPLPRSRLSLALQAGALGAGYSSQEGWLAFPTLGVQAQKHIGDRWRLGAGATWSGRWAEKSVPVPSGYNGGLYTFARRRSVVSLSLGAIRQLTEHVALGASGSVFQSDDCLSPLCAWRTRGAGGGLSVWVRPWHWLTLGAGAEGGLRYRPLTLPDPQNPTTPVATPPRSIAWVGAFGSAVFYW